MAKSVYYNTKTSATCEMTEKDFLGLSKSIKVKYRLANEDEIAIHSQRASKKATIDKRYADIDKRNEKTAAKKKAKRESVKRANNAEKTASTAEATTDTATSEGAE